MTPEKVTLGMDEQWWFPLLAPDELALDGKVIGHERIEMFDDGSHGDRIAGDGVYARGGVTTKMKPRALDPYGPLTARGHVMLGSLELTLASEIVKRQLSYTDGSDHSLFPGSFYFSFIEASTLGEVRAQGSKAQQTDHVLNVVDPALQLAALKCLAQQDEAAGSDASDALVPLADQLEKQVDFLYVYPALPVYGSLQGAHLTLSNTDRGTGADYDPPYPVDRNMKALILLSFQPESPIHHEIMHQWAVYLDASFGFDSATHHWGTAGTLGVLGGFDPATLVDHGDGTYTVDRFEPGGGNFNSTHYSDIELYLMGLLPAAQLAPVPVLIGPTIVSSTNTTVTVQSELRQVTLADIVAKHGTRTPAASSAQKDFEAAFVIVSERLLTPAEMAWVDSRARAIETSTPNEILSFHDATGGRGNMRTLLAKP